MADLSDVENALVNLINATVYPNGTSEPSAIANATPCRVYRGWPNARALDADIAAGKVNITVFQRPGMTRNTSRFPKAPFQTTVPTPTITVAVSGSVVTFGGATGTGNLCGIAFQDAYAGYMDSYAYAAAPTDTPQAVAAALAAQIPGANVSGSAVTVPASPYTIGRVVAVGTSLSEVRRQVQGFLISCWCFNPANRDAAASLVDAALGAVDWLTLADGTGGHLRYHGTFVNDVPSKDALWRRDLIYTVEYPTTLLQSAPQLLFPGGLLIGDLAGVAFGDVLPSTSVETDGNGNVLIDSGGNLIGT